MTIELTALAAASLSVIGPYLNLGSAAFAEKAGDKLAEKAGDLWQALRKKFAGDDDAEKTLSLAQAKPESEARMSTLAEVLVEKMEADPEFASLVNQLIGEAREADERNLIVSGKQNITAGRDMSGNTIIFDNSKANA